MRSACVAGLLVVAAVSLGCSSATCSSIIEPHLVVTNAVTGAALCGATITMVGDAGVSRVVPVTLLDAGSEDGGSGCDYEVDLGVGTTVLTVSMAGFASATVTAVVEIATCGQPASAPPVVTVALTPG